MASWETDTDTTDQTEMGTDKPSWGAARTVYDKPDTLLQTDTISKIGIWFFSFHERER